MREIGKCLSERKRCRTVAEKLNTSHFSLPIVYLSTMPEFQVMYRRIVGFLINWKGTQGTIWIKSYIGRPDEACVTLLITN